MLRHETIKRTSRLSFLSKYCAVLSFCFALDFFILSSRSVFTCSIKCAEKWT
jgi:hypothetical protein